MANRTIRTPEKGAAFLEALSTNGGNVVRACADTGFSRNAAYQWRADDPEFTAKWDRAVEIGTDALEDEALRRAHDGTERPVFQKGVCVGHVREYSDTLLIFMLKARRPEKFKDRVANEHSGRLDVGQLTDAELEAVIRGELARAGAKP